MRKSYRIGTALLAATLIVLGSGSQSTVAQRFRINTGGSNQGNNNNKKDKDNENNNNQGNNNNQSNQGNQGGNNGNNSNSNNNLSKEDKVKQFLQNKINQGQGGNQGQFNKPGSNNSNNNFNNGFRIGNPGNAQPTNQRFRDDDHDKDWDHNKNRLNIGVWDGNRWQGSHKADNWNKVFGHNHQMFSKQWYDDHPRAWRWDDHDHGHRSNVWVVATVPGMYQWLGWGSVPQQYQVNYGPNNRFDPADYGDWYPLGVYSLMASPDDVGTRVVQLAVDRHGHLNGTYYDMITDSSFQIAGDVQQQTQRAQWTLNANPNVRFSANMIRLLQPDGSLSVQLPGGEQRWQFVRLENEQQP